MKALEIKLKCIGSPLHAFSEALKISKVLGDDVKVDFGKFEITVRTDSNINDLMEIHRLSTQH